MSSNSDLFSFAIRLVQAYSPQTFEGLKKLVPQVGQNQGVALESQQPTREQFRAMKDQALQDVRDLAGSVTLLIGTRYTGKSSLCWRLCEYFGRPAYAVSPEEPPPNWITERKLDEIVDITLVPPMSTLVLDDLPSYASNRDYNDELVQAIEALIPVVRKRRKLHLIISTQSTVQADKYIGADCELAFLKPLGTFVEERPVVRAIYKKFVRNIFEGRSQDWIHRHAVMIHNNYKGVIEIAEAKK